MNNALAFQINFFDNLTNPLQKATSKSIFNLGQLEKAKGRLGAGGNGLLSSLGGVTGGLGGVAGAAMSLLPLLGVGAGLAGAFIGVINTGKDFTKTMSNVKALLDASDTEYKQLTESAIALGAATTFSSTQVADAQVVAAQAGLKANQIIAAMPGFLDLAASSNVGLAEAVEIGLSTMNQFGLKATDMSHIVDQLSFATTRSATGMIDMAEGLRYVAPAAAALGVPLSEVLSIQGILADRGLKGSVATRALSTSFQRLAAPTKQMKDMMTSLNLEFFDSEGKFIGINNLIQVLETRMKGFTDEQKANTLSILFGNEAFGEMQILLNKGSAGLRKFTSEIENSQGTAGKIAKTQLDNLSGDLEQFGGAWESFQLKLFTDGESGFRGLVQMGTAFIDGFSKNWEMLTEPIREVWGALKDVATEIGNLFGAVGAGEFDLFQFVLQNIGFALKELLTPVKWLLQLLKEIFSWINKGIGYIKGFFGIIKDSIQEIVKLAAPATEILEGLFTFDLAKVKRGFGNAINVFKNFGKETTKTFESSPLGLNNPLTSFLKQDESGVITFPIAGTGKSNNGTKPINGLLTPSVVPKIKTGTSTDVIGSGNSSNKSVSVTINNLVNSLSVNGNSIPELETKIKDVITKTLIGAVKDFEVSYN